MRTRIADLERRVQLVEQSGLATRSRTETLRALLRLARAAKNWHRLPMLKHERELRAALDAFDWSE